MSYSGPDSAFNTPGGKCVPLMNRTVRELNGAWSLEKNAAVRASDAATSSAGSISPKFESVLVGAPALLYTASTVPRRSVTAMVSGTLIEEAAAFTI